MSATVVFSRRVKTQIRTITRDLKGRSPQAARDFVDALDAKTKQLAEFPKSSQAWEDDVRRMLLGRVPYSLFSIFDATRGVVTIIACYHDRSDPGSWRP